MRRPVIREMSSWSSMRSWTTESSFSLRSVSMPSSFCAWPTVRGNPSRTKLKGETRQKASRARDASNHAPVLARLVVLELVLDHVDDDVVREQPASVHDLLRLDAELRLRGDLLTQHVASGEVTHAKLVADAGSLRALA